MTNVLFAINLPKINLASLGRTFAVWLVKKSILKLITKRSLNKGKSKNHRYMAESRTISFPIDEVDVIVTAEQIDGGDIQVTLNITNSDLLNFTVDTTGNNVQFFVGSRPKKRKK
jgi:hypothetical protein